MNRIDIFRVPMNGPGDMSGLLQLIEAGMLDPRHIAAILGKTEGNGGVNDFTREYACAAFSAALAPWLDVSPEAVPKRIALIMSGGTEGVLSPHATIFARVPAEAPRKPARRLAIGIAATRDFEPQEIGRAPQILATRDAVRAAMEDAHIHDPADVHLVQIKCPLLTSDRVEAARVAGQKTVTDDSYASMGYSRGASALGVGLALGEIAEPIADGAVLRDWSLYSAVASTSAGIELMNNVAIVMGNAEGAPGEYVIGHAVMQDAIDVEAVLEALACVGACRAGDIGGIATARIVNIFAKVEPSPDGQLRGYRHTMLNDTDISATRHARAASGGLIAALAGSGAVYVSGGAEHQGPQGGGPVAVIVRGA